MFTAVRRVVKRRERDQGIRFDTTDVDWRYLCSAKYGSRVGMDWTQRLISKSRPCFALCHMRLGDSTDVTAIWPEQHTVMSAGSESASAVVHCICINRVY